MGSRLEKNSSELRKRIERHEFNNEEGEEYNASKFGGVGEYLRRKRVKLQNKDADLRAECKDKPQIFKDIVAHVNGYTQPSLQYLHEMIVTHGGGFVQYLDGKTGATHIIASNVTQKKAIDFRKYRLVRPAWIVDSVTAGKLLPWENYRLVDEAAGQKVLSFSSGSLSAQLNERRDGYREESKHSWWLKASSSVARTSGSVVQTSGERGDVAGPDLESGAEVESVEAKSVAEPTVTTEELAAANKRQHEADDQNEEEKQEKGKGRENPAGDELHGLDQRTMQQALTEKRANTDDVAMAQSNLTAEQHNTILLSDPHIRKSSVLNPDFLNQYYSSSRLHHLSTWKAELKSRMQALTASKSASQQTVQKLPAGSRRYVLHVDFDSFFVAVSLLSHPELADKPCVVAHGSGSGSEIASCNYPARKFGISNGMWMRRAQEKCKDIRVLPYNFPAYEEASRKFYEAILDTGGVVQSVSIDEALVDISTLCIAAGSSDGVSRNERSVEREEAKADAIAQGLRDRIKGATGCAVSVGIGGNILLAKLALRKAKPAGQHHVLPADAIGFISGLTVRDLPGVAYSIGGKLEEMGIKFIKDVRDVSKERLIQVLGPKTGEKIHLYARGIDKTQVGDQVVRKSVSAEVNWGVRFETQEQVDEFMTSLCAEVERRLVKERVRGKQLTVKVMRRARDAPLDPPKHLGHGKCDTFNKSMALGVATCDKTMIAREVLAMMRTFGFRPGELRGLGVQLTKLEPLRDGTLVQASQPRLRFAPLALAGDRVEGATHDDALDESGVPESEERRVLGEQGPEMAPEMRAPGTAGGRGGQQRQGGQSAEAADDDNIEAGPSGRPKRAVSSGLQQLTGGLQASTSSSLDTSGTQFVLPTQVDATVLAELPADIRARLARSRGSSSRRQGSSIVAAAAAAAAAAEAAKPARQGSGLLTRWQRAVTREEQARLERGNAAATAAATTTVGGKADPSKALLNGAWDNDMLSVLPDHGHDDDNDDDYSHGESHEGDGIRSRSRSSSSSSSSSTDDKNNNNKGHKIAEAKQQPKKRQADCIGERRGGSYRTLKLQPRKLDETFSDQDASRDSQDEASSEEEQEIRILELPLRPLRPIFTVRKLWQIDELRAAVAEWHAEFRVEGPHQEDVQALARYLASVVQDECNMDKASAVIRWFGWLLDTCSKPSHGPWRAALLQATTSVSDAQRLHNKHKHKHKHQRQHQPQHQHRARPRQGPNPTATPSMGST